LVAPILDKTAVLLHGPHPAESVKQANGSSSTSRRRNSTSAGPVTLLPLTDRATPMSAQYSRCCRRTAIEARTADTSNRATRGNVKLMLSAEQQALTPYGLGKASRPHRTFFTGRNGY
jgi:hypothetical protein